VTFVMALTSVVAWSIQTYVLVPLGIEYMQTIVFILVIAALVQMVEIMLKKVSPSLYQALGIFLPLITTNCAVLGVAILMISKEHRLFRGDGHRLRIGAGAVRRYSRAARTGGCPQGRAGGSRGADYGRYFGNGLHGFLRAGITVIGTKRDL
jgi:hypothetical protein